MLAGRANSSTARFWLMVMWRRQRCGRLRAAIMAIGWAPTDTREPNWAYDSSDGNTWHAAWLAGVVSAQFPGQWATKFPFDTCVIVYSRLYKWLVCMFSHMAVYSHGMRTKWCIIDSPQQNVATLFSIKTLYSAGMHINYRSINSKNTSQHFVYDNQTSCCLSKSVIVLYSPTSTPLGVP